MDAKNIQHYIVRNAIFQVINRAVVYQPKIIDRSINRLVFECKGTSPNPYEIEVSWNQESEIISNCTCPYSGEGICKHEVASLNLMIELIKTKQLLIGPSSISIVKKKNISKDKKTMIPCNKGVIDIEQTNKINFGNQNFYFSPIRLKLLKRDKILAEYNDFRNNLDLSLTYDQADDLMEVSCSCKKSGPCYHEFLLLKEIIENYGVDYFSPNFEDAIKNQFIRDNNLNESLSFDDVFHLIIDEKGIQIEQKVGNIVNVDDGPIQLFETDRKELFLPSLKDKKENIAVGLCIEKRGNSTVEIYPFSGKLNKAKTEISTKLRDINETNLTDVFEALEKQEDIDFVIKSSQLNQTFLENFSFPIEASEVKNIFDKFSTVIEYLSDRPIYLYDNRDSFIKRNIVELNLKRSKDLVPFIKISENEKFYQLDLKLKIKNKEYSLKSTHLLITPVGVIVENEWYSFSSPEECYMLLKNVEDPQINVLKTDLTKLRDHVIKPLSVVFEFDFSEFKELRKKIQKSKVEKHVYLSDEEGEFIVLKPMMSYNEQLVTPLSKEKIWDSKNHLSYLKRDEKAEQSFADFLQELHPQFKNKTDFFYLTTEEALESLWLMDVIEKLRNNDIKVFGLNNLNSIKYNLNKPTFSMNVSSGTDWFDMKMDIQFGDQKVDLRKLQKAVLKKSNYVELKDGSLGILPKKWIEKYKKYFKLGQIKKDSIEVSNFQFNIIDELYEELEEKPEFFEELYQKKQRLTQLPELKDIPKPKNLKATLRPYQQEGLNWLVFLNENKLGGCLADDMGLGKTIQTIALLQHLKNITPKKEQLPHLIIAPTSLIFNWQAELLKFAPKLKVLIFTGANRDELKSEINQNDIVLTTYGSLIKDIEFHKNHTYDYVILDESQAIKNPQSQRFKAVRLLSCKNRLALTGTPIENNTFDLYSQFNFINPGIFGSVKHFRSTFSDAIDKEQDRDTSELLSKVIHPFIMRRTKSQVATELPPKTESMIYCEMSKEQQKVYDHFKEYFRQKLMQQIEEEGVNRSQMYILQGLTKLRQICNSTELADKDKDYGAYSAKLDELVRHLKEKVNNHKVLVFSQFVGMLQIVKKRLEKDGIKFEYLDGQTRNREEKVNNFQSNDEIRVFLISLKAGGTGLNLTKADYVYLIDPWWNPAVESQAIDRSYRIGQDKKVMAYRMICKDTIEEKIVQLQEKKKTVASDVIQVDTEKKTFNQKDVELLFQ